MVLRSPFNSLNSSQIYRTGVLLFIGLKTLRKLDLNLQLKNRVMNQHKITTVSGEQKKV